MSDTTIPVQAQDDAADKLLAEIGAAIMDIRTERQKRLASIVQGVDEVNKSLEEAQVALGEVITEIESFQSDKLPAGSEEYAPLLGQIDSEEEDLDEKPAESKEKVKHDFWQ